MPVLPKPTAKTDWTVGNPNFGTITTEPSAGKKLAGWTAGERPAHQFMNWVHYITDQWVDYLESITDDHETRLDTVETTITNLGLAANITASQAGHTYALGANVQLQLDAIDTFLEDLANAVTNGQGADLLGYVPGVPTDWDATVPDHVGDSLDQLANRMRAVEAASQNTIFIDKNLADFCIPPNDPVDGNGNIGLTSNVSNNPRDLKFSDLSNKYGEERIYFQDFQRTGKSDSAGRPEWALKMPSSEVRVLFYGNWLPVTTEPSVSPSLGYLGTDVGHWRKVVASTGVLQAGSYFTVTGVFDGIALCLAYGDASATNNIDVTIDGVSTGVPLTNRYQNGVNSIFLNVQNTISDPTMLGLGHGIHTVKFTETTGANFYVNGVVLIHSNKYQMPGKSWVSKTVQSYNTKTTITDPVTGPKGAKILRYIDRTDNLIKDAFNNTFGGATSVAGSVGSGATNITVVDAATAGIVANTVIEISDGPTNMERIRVTSVGGNTLTLAGAGTVGSYTNPVVLMYCRVGAAVNHSNEREQATRGVRAFSDGGQSYSSPGIIYGNGIPYIYPSDNQALHVGCDVNWGHRYSSGPNARYHSIFSMYPTAALAEFRYRFIGTGFDIYLDNGTITSPGGLRVMIDGVDCGQIATIANTDSTGWYKVCSDLPEGSHTVEFVVPATGSSNVGPVFFKEYETKYPSLFDTLARGNLISIRTARPSYLFDSRFNGLSTGNYFDNTNTSRGVVLQSLSRDAIFKSPTNGWGYGSDGNSPTRLYYGYTAGAIANDYVERWFFGTGFDFDTYDSTDRGIIQVIIDGNNASAANFPSLVVQCSAASQYNSSNGQIDGYISTRFVRYSFANISVTPQWHRVRFNTTATKNVSSSNYHFYISDGFYIHNMPFEMEQAHEQMGAQHELKVGGFKDLRTKRASDFGIPQRNYGKCYRQINGGSYPATNHSAHQNNMLHFRSYGYPVKLKMSHSWVPGGTNQSFVFYFIVDEVILPGHFSNCHTNGNPIVTTWTDTIDLPAGWHTVRLGSTSGVTVQDYTSGTMEYEEMIPTQGGKL